MTSEIGTEVMELKYCKVCNQMTNHEKRECLKCKKKETQTEAFVRMLEEAGAKVVDVTPKTIEQKRLEKLKKKLNKIFNEMVKNPFIGHPEFREAMFENNIPICTSCGFLMVQETDSKLWKCDNSKCKRDKNIRMSIG